MPRGGAALRTIRLAAVQGWGAGNLSQTWASAPVISSVPSAPCQVAGSVSPSAEAGGRFDRLSRRGQLASPRSVGCAQVPSVTPFPGPCENAGCAAVAWLGNKEFQVKGERGDVTSEGSACCRIGP